MLSRQKATGKPITFSGGLEAAALQEYQCDLIESIKPKRVFFAYDTPDDYEPLVTAGKMLRRYRMRLSSKTYYAYILIGYPGDSIDKATKRIEDTYRAGFWPFPMVYVPTEFSPVKKSEVRTEWKHFARLYLRPQIANNVLKTITPYP